MTLRAWRTAALLAALAGCGVDAAGELALGKRLLADAGRAAAAPEAALHLRRAAEHGLPAAAYHLGLLYRRGAAGVHVDRVAALRWMQQAAEAGLPDAQFILGQMLAAGEGVPADPARARAWFEQAAEHDHAGASLELALAYQRGALGVAPDEQAATRYFMEARHALSHRRPPP